MLNGPNLNPLSGYAVFEISVHKRADNQTNILKKMF